MEGWEERKKREGQLPTNATIGPHHPPAGSSRHDTGVGKRRRRGRKKKPRRPAPAPVCWEHRPPPLPPYRIKKEGGEEGGLVFFRMIGRGLASPFIFFLLGEVRRKGGGRGGKSELYHIGRGSSLWHKLRVLLMPNFHRACI